MKLADLIPAFFLGMSPAMVLVFPLIHFGANAWLLMAVWPFVGLAIGAGIIHALRRPAPPLNRSR